MITLEDINDYGLHNVTKKIRERYAGHLRRVPLVIDTIGKSSILSYVQVLTWFCHLPAPTDLNSASASTSVSIPIPIPIPVSLHIHTRVILQSLSSFFPYLPAGPPEIGSWTTHEMKEILKRLAGSNFVHVSYNAGLDTH